MRDFRKQRASLVHAYRAKLPGYSAGREAGASERELAGITVCSNLTSRLCFGGGEAPEMLRSCVPLPQDTRKGHRTGFHGVSVAVAGAAGWRAVQPALTSALPVRASKSHPSQATRGLLDTEPLALILRSASFFSAPSPAWQA